MTNADWQNPDSPNYNPLTESDLPGDAGVLAAIAKDDGNFIVADGTDWVAEATGTALGSLGVTAFAQTILDDANVATAQATLEVDPAGTDNSTDVTIDANADTLLSLTGQAIGLDTQTANTILAGPTTGGAAVPTFRAQVAADLPAISLDTLTDGSSNATNVWLGSTQPTSHTGVGNTVIGLNVMQSVNGNAASNVAVGNGGLYSLLSGSNDNNAIGINALYSTTTGSRNVGVGSYAGAGTGTGSPTAHNSVFIGHNAGAVDKGAANNTLIGAYTDTDTNPARTGVVVIGQGQTSLAADYSIIIGDVGATADVIKVTGGGLSIGAGGVGITGDNGTGTAGLTTITGATDTPTTDPGWTSSDTAPMTAPDGYAKAYIGTQAVVIPYWNT